MGGGANLYSLEAISDALLGAGAIAASSRDEQQIVRGYLVPLEKVLQAGCVAFFPSASSPLQTLSLIQLHTPEKTQYELPLQLLAAMELSIRNAAHQTITSQDAAFLHGHLKHIPGACTSSSSMWSCVPAGETDFGTIGIFDVPGRAFDRVEQQVLRTFALQLSYALKSLLGRKQAAEAANPNSREIHRYIENTQFVGNVARDLTNPLTALFGFIDLLRAEQLNDRSIAYLRKIQTQAEKMQDIVMAMHAAPKPPRNHADEHDREQFQIPNDISLVPAPSREAMMMSQREAFIQTKPPAAAEETRTARPSTGRSCVLVIQKNDAVVEFEKSVLAALNAEVLTANTGSEAVTQLQSQDVHAVIMGDELEGEWRSKSLMEWIDEHRPDLKDRVLLTVSAQPKSEIVDLIERRHVPFVTKPLQIMDLFAGMRRILGFSPDALDKKFLN